VTAARSTAAVVTKPAVVAADAAVLPEHITAGRADSGPRFGDNVWDVRPFVPRTAATTRVDFTILADPDHVRTAKEYLYSRIRRGIPTNKLAGAARPMKITGLANEFQEIRIILRDLTTVGAPRLADVTREHLEAVLARWRRCPDTAAGLVGVVKHIAAHGQFLTDRMSIAAWPGRGANLVAGRCPSPENTTPRIPEQVTAPLVKAAVFYLETAVGDLLAAQAEIAALEAAVAGVHLEPGRARDRVSAFIEARREAGRGIPARPRLASGHRPAPIIDGIVQAPNGALIGLLAGIPGGTWYHRDLLAAAGDQLGYEQGGLDTQMSAWPETRRPWRPRLDPVSLSIELSHTRTAAWIVIAYLSGMRDAEVRELSRDCAFTEPAAHGRVRYKLRGRVFKDRALTGDEAEWVVLDVVHRAVNALLRINNDPTHLFGRSHGNQFELLSSMRERLAQFRAHCNNLFSTSDTSYIPDVGDGPSAEPWTLTTTQFRRTLAWHIAHQPFGVVAGARQYQHAAVAVFEGYAGTSASGFGAEVAAEEAVARLDYVQDLYRDWVAGAPSGGGAAANVNAEFERIRAELDDLPGTVADPARLRAMLDHLAVTLHPGVLGDCFFRPDTALCAKRAKPAGKPLPMLNNCLSCPNARRTATHLPRLQQARDQARHALEQVGTRPLPPLQHAALTGHIDQLDQLVNQCGHQTPERQGLAP
jgi:flavin reductase (DIM6/NTAB) family NADH-FMN oxidoreductase RutF